MIEWAKRPGKGLLRLPPTDPAATRARILAERPRGNEVVQISGARIEQRGPRLRCKPRLGGDPSILSLCAMVEECSEERIMSKLPFSITVQQGALPKLAAEVSAANTEVINLAEALARQARETSGPEPRGRLLHAASRLVEVNRTVNTSVETAIGSDR